MSLREDRMEAFQYTALPARVVFGFGTIDKVADELVSLGRKRAFVVSDPHHATGAGARLMRVLGDSGIQLSIDAVMHTPVEVTERVMEKLTACNADCIVSLGGGSTIGLAKAIGRVARALGADHAPQALFDLAVSNIIGICVLSSGLRFENSWTTPLTDAGLPEGRSKNDIDRRGE